MFKGTVLAPAWLCERLFPLLATALTMPVLVYDDRLLLPSCLFLAKGRDQDKMMMMMTAILQKDLWERTWISGIMASMP